MDETIRNLATNLFADAFDQLFTPPIHARVTDRVRQRHIVRQIGVVSDAAGQGLSRQLILNWPAPKAEELDAFFAVLRIGLQEIPFEDVWPPGGSAEARARSLANRIRPPEWSEAQSARFGIALESLVASLWQAGAVFHAWQEVGFSASYEPPQALARRLEALADAVTDRSRLDAALDERFELAYRDYLLQRFARLDAGTLRAVSAATIGVDDLFVMPTVERRTLARAFADAPDEVLRDDEDDEDDEDDGQSRAATGDQQAQWRTRGQTSADEALFEGKQRLKVLIGAPGSGKSTLLLWVQRQVAGARRVYLLADEQAIPLLIRVREVRGLTLDQLRENRRLIELTTGNQDVAGLMPNGWLDRQFVAGRVLLLLDGLDETQSAFRDDILLPWLASLMAQYTGCHAIVSSRPAGFPDEEFAPNGQFGKWAAADYSLCNFDQAAIRAYIQNWFTQIRLAQNEPGSDAIRGGVEDAAALGVSLETYQPVAELAQIPLLLSAICLIYHFEGGRLPDDRAVLYRLCVEGLLDRWDTQKGMQSRFSFADKLLFCRELATAMTAGELRECPVARAHQIAQDVLSDKDQAASLVEHIQDRAGLVIERSPGMLSFAHLTFQEYLTAVAVRDENLQGVTIQTLADSHTDQRWREVILLFCRLAPPALARQLIDNIRQAPPCPGSLLNVLKPHALLQRSENSARILKDAYYSCPLAVRNDISYRAKIYGDILRTAAVSVTAPYMAGPTNSTSFVQHLPEDTKKQLLADGIYRLRHDVDPLAISLGMYWISRNEEIWNVAAACRFLDDWARHDAGTIRQAVILFYMYCSHEILITHGRRPDLWRSPLSNIDRHPGRLQAEAALVGLAWRVDRWARRQSSANAPRNILDHVPGELFTDLLECYLDSKWVGNSEQSAIFIMMCSGCTSQPPTIALRYKLINYCTSIANRLGSFGGSAHLRAWVQFLQLTA